MTGQLADINTLSTVSSTDKICSELKILSAKDNSHGCRKFAFFFKENNVFNQRTI